MQKFKCSKKLLFPKESYLYQNQHYEPKRRNRSATIRVLLLKIRIWIIYETESNIIHWGTKYQNNKNQGPAGRKKLTSSTAALLLISKKNQLLCLKFADKYYVMLANSIGLRTRNTERQTENHTSMSVRIFCQDLADKPRYEITIQTTMNRT